jgi:ABC-type Na+ efflux pump permease subunit
MTLGLLAFVAVVVMVAGKYFEKSQADIAVPPMPNPLFKTIRRMTLTILVISSSVLAVFGVLAIWDVITDKDILSKSLSSIGIIAFGSFIIVVTSLEREGNRLMNKGGSPIPTSTGTVAVFIILGLIILTFFGRLFH